MPGELDSLGFRNHNPDGSIWHWSGSPGISLVDGRWFPCDAFDGGDLQYGPEGYDTPAAAAQASLNYFT